VAQGKEMVALEDRSSIDATFQVFCCVHVILLFLFGEMGGGKKIPEIIDCT
jgi:hypothetical protein